MPVVEVSLLGNMAAEVVFDTGHGCDVGMDVEMEEV